MREAKVKIDLRNTDTKDRVIAEAQRLYQTGGYSHLNLDLIAKSLNITRPALYFHFPGGKNDLLLEVIKSFGEEIVRHFKKAIEEGHNSYSRIKNILLSVAQQGLLNHGELIDAELDNLTSEAQQEMQHIFNAVHSLVTQVIEEGIEEKELRKVDPNIAFFSFMGLCQQVKQYESMRRCVQADFMKDIPASVEELADQLLDLWFRGMEAVKQS